MGVHDKPISGKELHDFLEDYGCSVRSGRSGVFVAEIGGTEVRIPAKRKKDVVSRDCIKNLAHAMGASASEFRAMLGRGQSKAGKTRGGNLVETAGPSKVEMVELSLAVRQAAVAIDEWIKRGTHDGALYGRLYTELNTAAKALDGWPPEATGDAYVEVDDAGYRPRSYDPIETGVGRAVGVTAKAAKQRKTYTKWQIDEQEQAS